MSYQAKGIDISHHQAPASLDWAEIAKGHDFVYIRATYGTRPDARFIEHVKAAQGVGLKVGAYHFYRQTQPETEQIEAFFAALEAAGCGPGWLPPAIDVEDNEKYDGVMGPGKYRYGALALSRACVDRFSKVVIYTSQRDWRRIGNPDWLSDPGVLLWVAHWGVESPATPLGLPWHFWQYRVEPVPKGYAGAQLDQNVFSGPEDELPLIGGEGDGEADTLPPEAEDEPTLADVLAAVQSVDAKVEALKGALATTSDGVSEVQAELRGYQEEVRGTATSLGQRLTSLEQARRGNGTSPC